jgi:hypothetical protein
MNFPLESSAKSCFHQFTTASCELSIQVKPLPFWLTASPRRSFEIRFAQGRGGRGSVMMYSRPSSEK